MNNLEFKKRKCCCCKKELNSWDDVKILKNENTDKDGVHKLGSKTIIMFVCKCSTSMIQIIKE